MSFILTVSAITGKSAQQKLANILQNFCYQNYFSIVLVILSLYTYSFYQVLFFKNSEIMFHRLGYSAKLLHNISQLYCMHIKLPFFGNFSIILAAGCLLVKMNLPKFAMTVNSDLHVNLMQHAIDIPFILIKILVIGAGHLLTGKTTVIIT